LEFFRYTPKEGFAMNMPGGKIAKLIINNNRLGRLILLAANLVSMDNW
jgi:hypothetical protein